MLTPWEAYEHPHNVARESFVEVGGMIQPAPAPRFSRTPPAVPVPMDDGGRDVKGTLTSWGLGNVAVEQLITSGALS